jgi:hypothetical protein
MSSAILLSSYIKGDEDKLDGICTSRRAHSGVSDSRGAVTFKRKIGKYPPPPHAAHKISAASCCRFTYSGASLRSTWLQLQRGGWYRRGSRAPTASKQPGRGEQGHRNARRSSFGTFIVDVKKDARLAVVRHHSEFWDAKSPIPKKIMLASEEDSLDRPWTREGRERSAAAAAPLGSTSNGSNKTPTIRSVKASASLKGPRALISLRFGSVKYSVCVASSVNPENGGDDSGFTTGSGGGGGQGRPAAFRNCHRRPYARYAGPGFTKATDKKELAEKGLTGLPLEWTTSI